MSEKTYHWSPEEFRKQGYAMVDWIAEYLATVEERAIVPAVEPGDIRRSLAETAPEQPEPFEDIMRDLDEIVMPGVTHWQSPNWYAYFPANTSAPAILGDLASSGLGVQGMLWSTSPACTELESVVLDWLVDLMGFPQTWKTQGPGGGVIQMSASDSTHTALVVARQLASYRASLDSMVVYASTQAHSSIEKGARVAGFPHIRLVDVDAIYALVPQALEAAIAQDVSQGLTPVAVVSSFGTTGTTAVDPIGRIGEISRTHRLWHHVDGAYAGTAMICPEFRHHQEGLDLVDSYTFNPHKWMLTNFDCSAFYVADRQPLLDTMRILAPYLRDEASRSGHVIDYRDWHVPMGRRFRALKLWFVLRSYGAEGVRHHVREHVRLARQFADHVESDDRFELVAPVPFALVCFRHVAGNEATRQLAATINQSGEAYLTPSEVDGMDFIRVSIGQTQTEQRHVDRLWELIDAHAGPAS